MTTDEIFQVIAGEIQDGRQDAATWTRALAEADGDDAKTKARYIRLRLAQLQGSATKTFGASAATPASPVQEPRSGQIGADSDLATIRETLAQRLESSGRRSLYSQLDLSPRSADAMIEQAISSLRREEGQGRTLSAEDLYAVRTLGDPAARAEYDRKLLETFMRLDSQPRSTNPAVSEKSRNPIHLVAAVGLVAIAAYSGLGIYRENVRREVEMATAKAREAAVQAENNDRAARRQAAEELARRQAEVTERAATLAAEREAAQQFERDIQRSQAEDRRFQADQHRVRLEQEREARTEQEKARRSVMEAERELCMTARRNNNPGAVARYCR